MADWNAGSVDPDGVDDDLAALVVELLTCAPGELTDAELTDGLLALDRLRSRVEASSAVLAGAWDARQVWSGDAARSGGAWLTARSERTATEAAAVVRNGRRLTACPAVSADFRAGLLGPAKVDALLAARRGVEDQFAAAEADLVDHIRPQTVEAAKRFLANWRRIALATAGDDDGPEPPDTTDTLHLSPTFGGRWDLAGDLDPVVGEILENALNTEMDRMWRAGRFHTDDGLTLPKRRAIAHAELIRRGAEPATRHGRAVPLVSVFVDLDELLGRPIDHATQAILRRCHLTSGTTIDRATAERLMCDGSVGFITGYRRPDGTSHVSDVISPTRTATAAQRDALRIRDGGCVFPGCDAPTDWCDAHHIIPFPICQESALANLVLLCGRHHHAVHEGRYRLQRGLDGQIRAWRPDGTPLTTTPRGTQALDPDPDPAASPPTSGPAQHPPPPAGTGPPRSETGGCEPAPPGDRPPPQRPPTRRPPTRFRPLAERLTREQHDERHHRRLVLARLETILAEALSRPEGWRSTDEVRRG